VSPRVERERVTLSRTSDQTRSNRRDQKRDRALLLREDQSELVRACDRSFAGTSR
jgi:hypothetical protein